MRKDFIIEPYQIIHARAIGADCILLIAAALTTEQIDELETLANEHRVDVIVEVHDHNKLHGARKLNTPLIGINNRDLRTFKSSLQTAIDLLAEIPQDRGVVTESGILSRADVEHMEKHDVWAFLVGEAFMRADDPGAALKELFF